QVYADADPRIGEFLSMRFLGMQHQGEAAEAEDGQGIRRVLMLGVDLDDLGADDLVVELHRFAYVLDVQEHASNPARHSSPPLDDCQGPSTAGSVDSAPRGWFRPCGRSNLAQARSADRSGTGQTARPSLLPISDGRHPEINPWTGF